VKSVVGTQAICGQISTAEITITGTKRCKDDDLN